MRRSWWLALASCSFAPGELPAPCSSIARFAIDTGGAPPGYTVTVDISDAIALGGVIRVVDDMGNERDRVIDGSLLDVQVPPSGPLSVEVDDSATPPLADPARVYLFAESFDADAATALARFDARPSADWSVTGGLLHAGGSGRHPAAFLGMTLADGDIRARMRVGPAGGQQHNGLAARGNSMIEASMDGFVGQLMGNVNRRRICEYTNGISPPIELVGLNAPVTRGQWYSLRLRFVGDALEFFVDGSLTLTTIKAGSDGQMIGLYAHDPDVDFDDITVRMAMSPEPVVTLGPREDRCE